MSLLDCAAEILQAICMYLPLSDLRHWFLVCRTMYYISRDCQFWVEYHRVNYSLVPTATPRSNVYELYAGGQYLPYDRMWLRQLKYDGKLDMFHFMDLLPMLPVPVRREVALSVLARPNVNIFVPSQLHCIYELRDTAIIKGFLKRLMGTDDDIQASQHMGLAYLDDIACLQHSNFQELIRDGTELQFLATANAVQSLQLYLSKLTPDDMYAQQLNNIFSSVCEENLPALRVLWAWCRDKVDIEPVVPLPEHITFEALAFIQTLPYKWIVDDTYIEAVCVQYDDSTRDITVAIIDIILEKCSFDLQWFSNQEPAVEQYLLTKPVVLKYMRKTDNTMNSSHLIPSCYYNYYSMCNTEPDADIERDLHQIARENTHYRKVYASTVMQQIVGMCVTGPCTLKLEGLICVVVGESTGDNRINCQRLWTNGVYMVNRCTLLVTGVAKLCVVYQGTEFPPGWTEM